MSVRARIASAVFLTGLASAAPAATETAPGVPEPALQLAIDPSARLTLPIEIAGRGPYNFLVDTGAERTIVSAELAQELALGDGGAVRLATISGQSQAGTVLVPSLDFGRKRRLDALVAPVLSARNIGAAGMLGIDGLQTNEVVFDFARRKMTISKPRPLRHNDDEIVVQARGRMGRLVIGDAAVERQSATAVLDTGSELTIANEAMRRKLAEKRKLGTVTKVELISVTGAVILADSIMVKDLRLGNLTLHNFRVAFADMLPFELLGLHEKPALLLGMDALKLFDRVSVDFVNRRVRFVPPGVSSRPYGIEFAEAAGRPQS
jgi:predicted aspartyl protease